MTGRNSDSLHVCLICIEFFGDSIFGGFGRAVRFIGRELAERGVRVSVVIPRRSDDLPDRYEVDGMSVMQYDPKRPWQGIAALKECDADVYHSQDTSITSFLAQLAKPSAAHVITFRDPMDSKDWSIETEYAGMSRFGWAQYRWFIFNPLVALAIRRADSLRTAARFLEEKCARLYRLPTRPEFLASPVHVPESVQKAATPTVCYVGRWEGRKRIDLFFELARQCPEVHFIAVGGARDAGLDRALRDRYGGIPNVEMTGVLDQFETGELSDVMGRSWILVNTSLREGLPTTFIEAAAHRCAILSFSDPDRFASRFGRVAREGCMKESLLELLENDRWKSLGEAAFRTVDEDFSVENAISAHLALYRRLAAGDESTS